MEPMIFVLLSFLSELAFSSEKALSPEALYELSKHQKMISSTQWKKIASSEWNETYHIVPGDTLSGISLHFFNDPSYWPKLYAINNQTIQNPHEIYPGDVLHFSSGENVKLPILQSLKPHKTKIRSREWTQLPPNQPWQDQEVPKLNYVDQYGIDRASWIQINRHDQYELKTILSSEEIAPLGKIVGSNSEAFYLDAGKEVYIESSALLQIGGEYAVLGTPTNINSNEAQRPDGLAYPVLGKVLIKAVHESLFVAGLTSINTYLTRGSTISYLPPLITSFNPVAAKSSVEAVVTENPEISKIGILQFKEVILNRGSRDGVANAQIFRIFEHYDHGINLKITDSDFLPLADIFILQTIEDFSLGLVLRSNDTFEPGLKGISLTDVSQWDKFWKDGNFLRTRGTMIIPNKKDSLPKTADQLDQTNTDDSLGDAAKRELKQLERWKGNPDPKLYVPVDSGTNPPRSDGSPPILTPDQQPSATPELTDLVPLPTSPDTDPAVSEVQSSPATPVNTLSNTTSSAPPQQTAAPTLAPTESADPPATAAEDLKLVPLPPDPATPSEKASPTVTNPPAAKAPSSEISQVSTPPATSPPAAAAPAPFEDLGLIPPEEKATAGSAPPQEPRISAPKFSISAGEVPPKSVEADINITPADLPPPP